MIADLKPYPAMKDSGVEWLGSVPDQWSLKRTKFLFREKDHRAGDEGGVLLSLTRTRGLLPQTEASKRIASVENLSNYRVCRPGDLVMNRMQAWSGMFAVSSCDGVVSPDYSVFEATVRSKVKFFEHLFKTPLLVAQFSLRSKGIGSGFNRLYADDFGTVPVPVPPFPEQAAIVRFLDHVDRRIRRYIRAKQKLITLLEEQKQALIHQAVTGQVDVRTGQPYPAYKPSGVEWLGDVPEHWEVKRFKFLARVANGQVDPRRPEHRGKILVAPNHIRIGTGEIIHLETADNQGADSGKYEVRRGQVIYSKIRPNLRKAAIAPLDCLCSADMYPIAVRATELRPAYLLLLLLSLPFTNYAVDCSLRVAMPKVNREALGGCWFWYPSRKAQDAILEFIENVGGPSGLAIAQAAREISLLREYRTRLIADVVTGKLDVRSAAARLPDEDKETEPLDETDPLINGEEEPIEDATTTGEAAV